MSLSFTDQDELVNRFQDLSDEVNKTIKDIGFRLEKLGRLQKELLIIREELRRRNVEVSRS